MTEGRKTPKEGGADERAIGGPDRRQSGVPDRRGVLGHDRRRGAMDRRDQSNVPGTPGFVERRQRPTPMFSRYTFFGGRRGAHHGFEAYVDIYDLPHAFLVLLFFSLTVFDSLATVYYIDYCYGSEANPLAQKLLDLGSVAFVFAKGIPTACLLLFVMLHKNFRYGKAALIVGFCFYFLLSLYHLFLQSWVLWRVVNGMPLS